MKTEEENGKKLTAVVKQLSFKTHVFHVNLLIILFTYCVNKYV